jgi:hypothetical protein
MYAVVATDNILSRRLVRLIKRPPSDNAWWRLNTRLSGLGGDSIGQQKDKQTESEKYDGENE